MLPKVRVSHVDMFRGWLEEDDLDLGWLLNQLSSHEPTEAMLKGTAFHKALEVTQHGEVDEVTQDGYTFLFDGDFELALPEVREIRREKNYGGIVITGQVDCIQGAVIYDHKSTAHFDAEKYMRKYQWRLYLDIFNAQRFVWNIFEMQPVAGEYSTYRVTALHKLEQHRYPGLTEDCRKLAHRMRDFLAEYRVMPVLEAA